jgi:TolB-like protein/DNA-binding winged helix-turn-helix (wHTH) protein
MERTDISRGDRFAIGTIIVEPERNLLTQGADVFALEPKIMDVLAYLARHQGRVCARDEIVTAIWQVEFGADESLTRAISMIRKTLRQAGGQGRYIQTISKRGYMLQEPVKRLSASGVDRTKPEDVLRVKPAPAPTPMVHETIKTVETAPKRDVLPAAKSSKLKNVTLLFAVVVVASVAGTRWVGPQSANLLSQSFGSELAISPYGRSVAVMPFVDMSVAKDNQYFSDGMSEELSNELRKIEDLRIVGQRLGGASDYDDMSYEEIGDRLKVSHVIHGSVRKQGDTVRITTQLINTEDNSHVWSSNYDGTLDNVLSLQNRVAADIVLELSLIFSVNTSEPIDLEGVLPGLAEN